MTKTKPQMNADEHRWISNLRFQICVYLCSSVVPFLLFGCSAAPSQANIELRKQIQQKEAQIAELNRQQQRDAATIRSFQQQRPTVATLPQERLDQLFTTNSIELGRLTGGADLDPAKAGDEGIKVYVIPIDVQGDQLKAAGAFEIELFDLSKSTDNRVGRWEFDVKQARENWFGKLMLHEYVLACPWQQQTPEHAQLTLKVKFTDELTGRVFESQKVITVNPPPK